MIIQTKDELWRDLQIIREKIPKNKKIIFQTHFRPNIIYNDENKKIEKREIIYHTINEFCKTTENTYVYDPSIIIPKNKNLFDGDTHWFPEGHLQNFEYIYNHYIEI